MALTEPAVTWQNLWRELELLDRAESLAGAGSWGPWGLRPPRLAGTFF